MNDIGGQDSQTVELAGRCVQVYLSEAAQQALHARQAPLYVQMELYFSCLLRFKLRFSDAPIDSQSVGVGDKLYLSFRPVMTAQCGRDYEGEEPPLTDFPIHNAQAFVPRSVFIDRQRDQWQGHFEYR